MELRVEGLKVSFNGLNVLRNASLSLSDGETVLVTGASASGKTVLIKSILGLLGPSRGAEVRGEILINRYRVEPEKPPSNVIVGYQPQDFEYSFITPRVGEELVAAAMRRFRDFSKALSEAVKVLEAVGLRNYILRPINTLSGGEMQCVSLLRSLVIRPELLVLDEPFTQVDARRRLVIEGLLNELIGNGSSIIMSAHESISDSLRIGKVFRLEGSGLRVCEGLPKYECVNPSPTLLIEDLWFSYGGEAVLKGVNLVVESGEAVAIVGPNGAGKTTLVKLLMGFLKPAKGLIKVIGEDPLSIPDERLPRLIGYTSQFPSTCFLSDSVIDELRTASQLAGNRLDKALEIAEALGLKGRLNSPIHSLTKCEQLALSVTESLLFKPPLIIIDEVHQCCDHSFIKSLLKELTNLCSDSGASLLVTSHSEGVVSGCGFRIARIRDGVIEG